MRGMGNMQGMMKKMQKMQKEMMEAQEALNAQQFEGVAGGGMVKVVMNGQRQMLQVNLDESVVDPEDIEMLQDLIVIATNEAMKKAEETISKQTRAKKEISPELLEIKKKALEKAVARKKELGLIRKAEQEQKKQLEDANAELDGLEDEARKAGVPPGWAREQ